MIQIQPEIPGKLMLQYQEPLYRPPSEANSVIIQAALGCPNNTCSFCGMYKNRKYRVRPMEEVLRDIARAAELFPDARRVFLADGDIMHLPFPSLEELLKTLNARFPLLTRVGCYANGSSILSKPAVQLAALKQLKLGIAYMGLESGDNSILKNMHKHETAEGMTEAVLRARKAGIKMSVMFLLGLGGKELSAQHAEKTAETLNRMQPEFLSGLTVIPEPRTPLLIQVEKGAFRPLNTREIIRELGEIIARLELNHAIFRCNHASNPLPLAGRFPRDKTALIDEINFILEQLP